MEQTELIQHIALSLDRLVVSYALVGSWGSGIYGEPRFTRDIDVVLDMAESQIPGFCAAFPTDEYRLEPDALEPIASELRQSLTSLSEIRVKSKLKGALNELSRARKLIETQCGTDFDKNAIADAMKTLAEKLKDLGAWVEADIGASVTQFKALCEEFRSTPIKEVFGQLDRLGDEEEGLKDQPKSIGRVAQVSFAPILVAQKTVEIATKLIRHADRHARTLEEQFKGVDPKAEAEAISALFGEIPQAIAGLQPQEK